MRDKESNKIYTQKIVLDEYRGKELNITPYNIRSSSNSDVALFVFDTEEISVANSEGKLSGKLKEIADYAEETDNGNNVYMFVRF